MPSTVTGLGLRDKVAKDKLHPTGGKLSGKVGKSGKKDDDLELRAHQAAPLTALRDPDSFGPPPKHQRYYGTDQKALPAPGQGTTDEEEPAEKKLTPVQMQLAANKANLTDETRLRTQQMMRLEAGDPRAMAVPQRSRPTPPPPPRPGQPQVASPQPVYQDEYEEEEEEQPPQPAVYHKDTTGINTSAFAPPPQHRAKRAPGEMPEEDEEPRIKTTSGLDSTYYNYKPRYGPRDRAPQRSATTAASNRAATTSPPARASTVRSPGPISPQPPPPTRNAKPGVPTKPGLPMQPGLPARPGLPPRQNSHPDEHTPAPPPAYAAANNTVTSPPMPPRRTAGAGPTSPPPPARGDPSTGMLNQGATQRLGQAGVNVSALGIGNSNGATSMQTTGVTAPQPGAGQMSELQARFARMNNGGESNGAAASANTAPAAPAVSTLRSVAAAKAPPPKPPAKKPALRSVGVDGAAEAGAPPPVPSASKPR